MTVKDILVPKRGQAVAILLVLFIFHNINSIYQLGFLLTLQYKKII